MASCGVFGVGACNIGKRIKELLEKSQKGKWSSEIINQLKKLSRLKHAEAEAAFQRCEKLFEEKELNDDDSTYDEKKFRKAAICFLKFYGEAVEGQKRAGSLKLLKSPSKKTFATAQNY